MMKNQQIQGQLYVVSAPSGAGKTSLLNALIETLANVSLSVSHTTRAPRSKEINGQHYHFIDEILFKKKIQANDFLEYAKVFDYYYGTSLSALENRLNQGEDVILELDWQGAQQVRQKLDCISIFVLPPSLTALAERLNKRQQDSPSVIRRRMQDASRDIFHYKEFDYVIVNDVFNTALAQLQSIFQSQRLRLAKQEHAQYDLLAELLKNVSI